MSVRLLFCLSVSICLTTCAVFASGVASFTRVITVNGRNFPVTGIRVSLSDPSIVMKVGLATGCVGRTEGLAEIAKRYQAVAAINGSFFNAYTSDTLKNPDMSLITGGRLVFKSDIGTLLGFTADRLPRIGCVHHHLTGTVTHNGHRRDWYAYWVNRRPTASPCVTIFTRHWGATLASMSGTAVVVTRGVITMITQEMVTIPDDGFVIHIRGEETLLSYFHTGDTCQFTPDTQLVTPYEEREEDWSTVQEAVGCGPRVLVNGTPVFRPDAEGFVDPKVLSQAGARSAVGFTRDGILFFITTRHARVSDMGYLLKILGCCDGLNMDGGASSGLWFRGAYLTKPGRPLSNALLVVEQTGR